MCTVLILAGCDGGHTASPPPATSSAAASGIVQTRYDVTDEGVLQVDVLSLGRLNKDTLQLRLRVSNLEARDLNITNVFARVAPDTKDDAFSGLQLIDAKHLKAYYPYSDGKDRTCVCSGFPESNFASAKTSFESSIYYPAPPADVTKVDIRSELLLPFTDVPVAPHVNQMGDVKPVNWPYYAVSSTLTSLTDGPPGGPSADRTGDSVGYRLPGDVLFEFNKATLTPKAAAVLRSVAQKIDQAKAATVQIDGYTDNAGDDGYNTTLSEQRAAATQAELKKLVTRPGVGYKTAGHGEADPLAANDTAAGRQRNRRVTVTLTSG